MTLGRYTARCSTPLSKSSPNGAIRVAVGLTPHRGASRVLHREPIARAARATSRVLPLGHNALKPELAG